jgi:hypothetical protein
MNLTDFCIKAIEGDIGIGLLSCCGECESYHFGTLSRWRIHPQFNQFIVHVKTIMKHAGFANHCDQ